MSMHLYTLPLLLEPYSPPQPPPQIGNTDRSGPLVFGPASLLHVSSEAGLVSPLTEVQSLYLCYYGVVKVK
jgi:hypothetical protein